MGLANKLIY